MSELFVIIQKKQVIAVILCAALGLSAWYGLHGRVQTVFSPSERSPSPVVIVDAGHGGEDGGAVSGSGVKESGINLAIAKDLAALLRFLGTQVAMTRETENAVYSEGARTLREKKVSDLHNRADAVNRTEGAILISIHQNSLPRSESVRGAQVFYAPTERSEPLAQSIQKALNSGINLGCEKECRLIAGTIYLMNHVKAPAVLVECGFLSNEEDTRLLGQAEYRKKLAVTIAAGYLQKEEP